MRMRLVTSRQYALSIMAVRTLPVDINAALRQIRGQSENMKGGEGQKQDAKLLDRMHSNFRAFVFKDHARSALI